jgi:uncharacterized coiled-coil DUF342 family protein
MDQSPNHLKSSKTTVYLIVAVGLLIALVIYLMIDKKVVVVEKMKEIDEITLEKAILARDYSELAIEYDSIQTNNQEINNHLDRERERVSQLLEEIRTMKSANAAQISQYKKELSSLRNVMRSFVVQIDSLNARNQVLSQENREVKQQYSQIKDSYSELSKEKENLVQKVEIAARLETFGIKAIGLNNRGKETNKANRTVKISVCFTLLKNVTTPVGEKKIFMRIARPDGALLYHSETDLFQFEGSQINFSVSRIVEYGGENIDVCMFYGADEGELMIGKYTIDLFADGKQIGNAKLDLK